MAHSNSVKAYLALLVIRSKGMTLPYEVGEERESFINSALYCRISQIKEEFLIKAFKVLEKKFPNTDFSLIDRWKEKMSLLEFYHILIEGDKAIKSATDALHAFLMEYPVYQQLLNPASLAYNGMKFEDKPQKVRLKEGDTLAFVATGVRDTSKKDDPNTPLDTLIVPVVRNILPIIETAEKVRYIV